MRRLRKVAATLSPTSSPADGGGLHPRGHRSRKQSLSDNVPVNRIAATNGQESFKDTTADINNEIRRQKSHRLHDE
jgi:glycerol-3-phosphate O-acyltransferase / dihydroxyacetone phosphate acyltransferase